MSLRLVHATMSAMAGDGMRLRYDVDQVVEAVDRARGDGRYFLVQALRALPLSMREEALVQVVDKELRPDERMYVLAELTRMRPAAYLKRFVTTGLRSRSINVQQMTIAVLPSVVIDNLVPELSEQVEGWLRHRLANTHRENTWATWEVPAAALALLPSYGVDRVVALLDSVEPRMQAEERQKWRSIRRVIGNQEALTQGLQAWIMENSAQGPDHGRRDPTADAPVDRVMRRLGYCPANPKSKVYDPLVDVDVPVTVFDAGQSHFGPT